MSQSVLPMFFSRSFIVSGLIFTPLIHFEFIFVQGVRSVLISFFYMQLSNFSSSTYLRDHLSPIVYSCLLCQKQGMYRCMALSLSFLCCSIGLYISFFVPVPYCLDDYSFVVQSEVRKVDSSSSILLSQDCFGYLGSFVFPYEL